MNKQPIPTVTQKLFGMDEYQLKNAWRYSNKPGHTSKPFVTYTAAADHTRLNNTLTRHVRFIAPNGARLTLRALNSVHQFRSQEQPRKEKRKRDQAH